VRPNLSTNPQAITLSKASEKDAAKKMGRKNPPNLMDAAF
jgi:hypothetical protein